MRLAGQLLESFLTDTAARCVENPLEALCIPRICHHLKVGEKVLDLLSQVELDATEQRVGDAVEDQRLLQRPRKSIGAVEDGDVPKGAALTAQLLDEDSDRLSFLSFVAETMEAYRVSCTLVRPQILGFSLGVVTDQRIGGVENVLGRAVVLLEFDDDRLRVILLEIEDISEIRTTPPIDRLIGVAGDADVAIARSEEIAHAVLDEVGVLVLVDKNMLELLLVALEQIGVFFQEAQRQKQQIVEIHSVAVAQLFLIQVIDFIEEPLVDLAASLVRHELAAAAVLDAADLLLHVGHRPHGTVDISRIEQFLDQLPAIGLVVDRE